MKRIDLATLCSVVLFTVTFLGTGPGTMWGQSTADEYKVKAAFLFHFTQLVEWPPGTGNDNLLFLCTIGEDPFQGQLESTVAGKQVGSRAFRVRHLKASEDAHNCHVLFIGKAQDKLTPVQLANVRRSPVLTVGEADDFLEAGGMIEFCLEGNKIRFEINRAAAESAQLKISSQLLLLAKRVVGNSGGN